MSDPRFAEKSAAAGAAAARVRPGMTLALGSGTTAELALRAVAARYPDGGGLRAVASSRATERTARALGIPVGSLEEIDRFDLMIDGADEVTERLDLTKGGGGALFREKLLALRSREVVIAADATKLVRRLGERMPIPVEVVPFARPALLRDLAAAGWAPRLRAAEISGRPALTDNGNELLDLHLPEPTADPAGLDRRLKAITGVVETGIFVGIAHRLLLGRPDGSVAERTAPGAPGKP